MAIELTRLGVVIDPTEAEKGAKKAKDAARDMGNSMKRDLDKVEREAKDAGRTVDREGERMEGAAREARQEFNRLGRSGGFDNLRRGVRGGFGEIRSLIIDTLDVFGLLDNRIGQFVRRGDSLANIGTRAKSSFGEMAAAGTNATAAVTNLGAAGGRAGGAMAGLAGSMGPLIGILAGVAAGVLAVVAAFKALEAGIRFIASGFPLAAAFEDAKVSLAVLLGSFEDAEARMRTIEQFAAATPFETFELTETNRILQIFTDGALATTEGLTLIGDAAAGVDKPLNEVATWVGRLYASLKGGQPIGEATMRLLEMGAISPQIKGQLDELAASGNEGGQNFAEIWALAEQSLERFAGTMDLRSKTWSGLLGTLSDNWGILRKEIAAPIQDALKPALQLLIQLIERLIPIAQQFGQTLGTAITGVIQLLSSGQIGRLFGAMLLDGIQFAAQTGVRVLTAMVATVVKNLLTGITNVIKVLATGLGNPGLVAQFIANLLNGMMQALAAFAKGLTQAALGFVNTLANAFGNFWNENVASIEIFGKSPFSGATIPEINLGGAGAGVTPDFLQPGGYTTFAAEFATQMAGAFDNSRTAGLLQEAADQFRAENPAPEVPNVPSPVDQGLLQTPATTGTSAGGGAATSADDVRDATDALNEQGGALRSLLDEWGNLGKQADSALANLVGGITNDVSAALTDAITGTKSWQEAFEELGASVVRQIIEMVTQLWVQYTVQLLLNSVSGAFGGGGGLGGIFGGSVLHSGGTTDGAPQRAGRLPRYHQGGKASSERVAMLEKGESVVTAEQNAEIRDRLRGASKTGTRGSGGGQGQGTPVTIMNVTDPRQIQEAIAKNPDLIVNAINDRLPAVRRLVQSGDRR